MVNKLIKKIWFICLWLVSLTLAGCFHIPDEDWLLSTNEINTWNTDEEIEIEQAFNSFMDWIDMISSDWDNMKNGSEIDDIKVENNESTLIWDWISENGVDEEIFLQWLDQELIEKISSNFQALIDEETREEKENPSLLFNEWWTRVFNKELYKEIIQLWEDAEKPLYWILYKSENNWLYEYLCASALQDISWVDFSDENWTQWWSNAKEFLDLFTHEILK